MTTRIPLTRANLQFYTQAPRKKMERWLDAMVGEGVLDIDSDESGETVWQVRGAERPQTGITTVAELAKLDRLRQEALVVRRRGSKGIELSESHLRTLRHLSGSRGEKSLIASGVLSFIFGPFGWLYAAPLKEALPAILLYMVLCSLLPHFLLIPLLGTINLLSGFLGVLYALRNNQTGERTPLLPASKP